MAVLPHGEKIGQNLRGVKFIREPVPHGDTRVLRQFVSLLLGKAAILDAIVHAPEHARRVLHALLVADMRTTWANIGDIGPLVEGSYLKATARTRRGLLKNERDLLAFQTLTLNASIFRRFQFRC